MYLGSWKIDDLLTFYANTHRFDTGAATDADSAPSYRVYEDETGTPILTGSMALIDSSNTAGFYSEQITLSAANGFEKGKCYSVYISATVNSVTGTTHHTLQMEAEVDANTVSPTVVNANVTQISGDSGAADNLESYTDGTTPMPVNATQISGDSGAADNAEAFFDGTGYAGTNNVIPTVTTLTNAPSDSSGVTTLLSRLPAGLFTGLTNFAQWLGALAGKQAADATAQTEIRASGAGSGTYDPTTDSLEAQRDNTGTAGAGLTAIDLPDQTMNITGNITGNLSGSVGSVAAEVTIDAASKTGIRLSATGVDDVLDEVVLGSYTLRQLMRGIAASSIGKLSGAATTTVTIRSADDTKDVVIATVDADGNRSAITLDLT